MMKKILLLALAAMMLVVFAGCAKQPAPAPTAEPVAKTETPVIITMGTNAEFPPFEYINDSGKVDGFDPAFVAEIVKRIDAELKIENMEFKSLIASLSTGKIDMIAAGMTVTEERKLEVDFTAPYFKAVQKIIIPQGSAIKTSADLKDKVIGVQEGTTGDFTVSEEDVDAAEKVYNVKEVKRYKKGVDAVLDLINGRVDAVVIDSNPAETYVKENDGKIIAVESGMEPEDYAIAVKKGNAELLAKINKAIEEIKADGTYEKLVAEYIQ